MDKILNPRRYKTGTKYENLLFKIKLKRKCYLIKFKFFSCPAIRVKIRAKSSFRE